MRSLSNKRRNQVKARLSDLQFDPRPAGSEKLKGSDDPVLYRIRSGDYRIIYHVDYFRMLVQVTKVCDRRDAY